MDELEKICNIVKTIPYWEKMMDKNEITIYCAPFDDHMVYISRRGNNGAQEFQLTIQDRRGPNGTAQYIIAKYTGNQESLREAYDMIHMPPMAGKLAEFLSQKR
jgi:hypothetical protein